jgi:PPM family protein phosphatase
MNEPLLITSDGISDKGLIRSKNEDRFHIDLTNSIFVVSDGIGGQPAGDIAADYVTAVIPNLVIKRYIDQPPPENIIDDLKKRISESSVELFKESRGKFGLEGMGATLALLWINALTAYIATMGDSRVYRIRHEKIEKLTQDHTIAEILFRAGQIASDDVADHPAHGQLSRFFGMQEETYPDVVTLKIQKNDLFLLCTDGLYTMVREPELNCILKNDSSLHEKCKFLIEAAKKGGGKDNITCVLISCG